MRALAHSSIAFKCLAAMYIYHARVSIQRLYAHMYNVCLYIHCARERERLSPPTRKCQDSIGSNFALNTRSARSSWCAASIASKLCVYTRRYMKTQVFSISRSYTTTAFEFSARFFFTRRRFLFRIGKSASVCHICIYICYTCRGMYYINNAMRAREIKPCDIYVIPDELLGCEKRFVWYNLHGVISAATRVLGALLLWTIIAPARFGESFRSLIEIFLHPLLGTAALLIAIWLVHTWRNEDLAICAWLII